MTTVENQREDVLAAIQDMAKTQWDVTTPIDESTSIAELGVDSMAQMRAAALMEQKFGVKFLSEDTTPAATIGEFVDQVLSGTPA